ncbi:hydroxymethylglutaryl-CoA lyase [Brevibacterium oceani]|uniref:hydroxymethylglutaryl-CoA lyase n=1 Tax=Brevibacterium oceani TaxID=358099 RepID=UPI0015E7CB33|nr:hydroxymethylglutaryl-CoA lyase [Brevibacterium oceani]
MTIASTTPAPILRDVTLRDGLQLTGKMLGTERKVAIVRALLAAGIQEIELGSMARPDLVPPMANTLEVAEQLTDTERAACWIWVATPRQVERAIAAGITNIQYCLSVSDAHNQANIGRDTETSMAAFPAALELVRAAGGRIQLCLATSFTCPFDGEIAPDRVLTLARDSRAIDADDIVLCDTLGQAIPSQVATLTEAAAATNPDRRVIFHGHDTWGLGVANSLAAAESGASVLDGALGGLGGCPFAPGASGNTSSEDLLFATRPEWLTPSTFADLVELSESITSELGETPRSKAAQGARSKAEVFPWVIGGNAESASA